MRIGHGYDVHKFAENRKLILGGTEKNAVMSLACSVIPMPMCLFTQ